MAKNIGIITILNVNNYGAELQAFALQKKIQNLGYNSQIINYLYYKNSKFKKTKKSKPFVALTLIKKIKEFLFPYMSSIKSLPYLKQKKKRNLKFNKFHEDFTNLSKTYKSIEDLYLANLDYDIFIVGSDQVWNPFTNINIEPYFLTFAPASKLKISYASSFGVESIPVNYKKYYKELLSNLNFIGVREENGVSIVKEITGRDDAKWVLDPTLLLSCDEWRKYSIYPDFKEPYLLLYVLSDSEYIKNLAQKISKEKNLKIVRICKNAFVEDKTENVFNIIDAGPQEFLGLFLNASFILTTSFHGTCFSVNFEKPFYSILKKSKINNSRIISLLNYLNISERILYLGDEEPLGDNYNIDYNKVKDLLDRKTKFSLDYLMNSLNQ